MALQSTRRGLKVSLGQSDRNGPGTSAGSPHCQHLGGGGLAGGSQLRASLPGLTPQSLLKGKLIPTV